MIDINFFTFSTFLLRTIVDMNTFINYKIIFWNKSSLQVCSFLCCIGLNNKIVYHLVSGQITRYKGGSSPILGWLDVLISFSVTLSNSIPTRYILFWGNIVQDSQHSYIYFNLEVIIIILLLLLYYWLTESQNWK